MISLNKVNPKDRNFLVRCDLDVLDDNGEVKEHYRLSSCLKTLNYILKNNGKAYICGHIGKTQEKNEKFSTQRLKPFFEENLVNTNFEIIENLRFDPREEQNDENFAKELSQGKDFFINESFATSHRNHSSITTITKFLPSYLGFHFEEELENLNYVLHGTLKPLTIIIGGAKIESKKPTIKNFLKIADYILLGGKISGDYLKDREFSNEKIVTPVDNINNFDIGAETISLFKKYINESKTVFWSGPLGMVEDEKYQKGTLEIVDIISKSGVYSVVGGGDTLSFLEKKDLLDRFSFVSVGGSALLEYLSTQTLIGLEYLKKHNV